MKNAKINALKYATLPGILPRLIALLTGGFYTIAYSLASIFLGVRLLPASHPYLNPENIGTYGARHVFAAAAANLKFEWRHIDQIVVFGLMLLGMVLLIAQFMLLLIGLIAHQPVLAQTFFSHPVGEEQDIAMILFDRVFGVAGFFNSCVSTGVPCTDLQGNPTSTPAGFPFPFHQAFHDMLSFYSFGLFNVAVFIILYFISVVVTETAVEGSVLGKRYNKTWVPVRIIFFFALLIPISNGLNAGQLLTFHVAKYGSHFASNAWSDFNTTITGRTLTGAYDLLATPNVPELNNILQFVFLAKTCKIAEESHPHESGNELFGPDGIQAYLVRPPQLFGTPDGLSNAIDFRTTSFNSAMVHGARGQIQIVVGSLLTNTGNPEYERHALHRGNVRPMCGTLAFNVASSTLPGTAPHEIQALYYDLVKNLWEDNSLTDRAACVAMYNHYRSPDTSCTLPDNEFFAGMLSSLRTSFKTNMEALITAESADNSNWDISSDLKAKGWAGAAAWYNQIADLNGAVTSAVFNLPEIEKYPYVMEYVAAQNRSLNESTEGEILFNPSTPEIRFVEIRDQYIASILYRAFMMWNSGINYNGAQNLQGNFFLDAINAVFGTSGIYDLLENPDINPLAQLTVLGQGMMQASIRNIIGGFGTKLFSKLIGGGAIGELAALGADFFQAMGYAAFSIAFTLAHVLPMMPFIYFFFAVGGWLKGIFEAIVAMPLWALGHITRWDGEGVVGDGAINGYFLLFEIFLRPIMILFGMFASISIFSAMVMVLNDIFVLAVSNVGGFNYEEASGFGNIAETLRGPIDELFYTAVYTVICYMIGLSCFKLIDAIPNQIMRWMNFTIKTFQETTQNAAENLSGTIYKGANITSSKLGGQALGGSQLHALLG